ncbi:MAG: putative inositol oxygenase [Homavirus sp.]|uniref:Putative inositol oxygenase n=1 Tax=Homavirus sp. TaxID=2487769 RepID=A0A3G5A743_9VIRU|nr:MAG: putative inositol oxygenase [Homavirus sp.]
MNKLSISPFIIDGQNYLSFNVDDKPVGKCEIVDMGCDNTYQLKSIIIYKKHRGMQYSTQFWNLVEEWVKNKGGNMITLCAKEDNERFGKLVKLYESWGFCVDESKKISYVYDGEDLLRKISMYKLII